MKQIKLEILYLVHIKQLQINPREFGMSLWHLFPQVAIDYFKYRQAQQEKVDMTQADTKNNVYPV